MINLNNSEVNTIYTTTNIENYMGLAAATLLLHDTVITLSQEIELVWKRQRSAVTFLFAANRVLSTMYAISLILGTRNWPQLQDCMGIDIYGEISCMLLFSVWALFSALRVYAIGGLAWRTATGVFLLALAPFGTNLYNYTTMQFSDTPLLHCVAVSNIPVRTGQIMEITTRGSVIVADLVVLLITWRHTYDIRKHARAMNIKTSLATLLLRDGTVFFAIGLVMNAAQIGTFFASENVNNTSVTSYLSISISCIILSRFVLSLRQLSQGELHSTPSGVPSGTIQIVPGSFASIMGAEVDVSLMLYSTVDIEDDDELLDEAEASYRDMGGPPLLEAEAAIVEELRIGGARATGDGTVLV